MFILISFILFVNNSNTDFTKNDTCIFKEKDLPRQFRLKTQGKYQACRFQKIVRQAADTHNLDHDLINALIVKESLWKSLAKGSSGECGLTQVIPKYTNEVTTNFKPRTCEDLLWPETSIRVGTKILKWWISYRKFNVRRGLCSYNGGYRGCSIRSTQMYADDVLTIFWYIKMNRLLNTLEDVIVEPRNYDKTT